MESNRELPTQTAAKNERKCWCRSCCCLDSIPCYISALLALLAFYFHWWAHISKGLSAHSIYLPNEADKCQLNSSKDISALPTCCLSALLTAVDNLSILWAWYLVNLWDRQAFFPPHLVAHVGPSLLHPVSAWRRTFLKERRVKRYQSKTEPGKLFCFGQKLKVIVYYWVMLSVCGVMCSPPVWGPFPCVPHHVIQAKAISREGHHLQGMCSVTSCWSNAGSK